MDTAQTVRTMSPKLVKVVERAKRDPRTQFTSLAHLLGEEALKRAYGRIRKNAAVGIDGITKGAYGEALDENIGDLHRRLKSMKYRHQSIRRVHIPKEPGKTRPIGISCIEDKIVQGAIAELLEVVYEPMFLTCSYGFRRKRSAHDALRAVNRMAFHEGIGWILEADIQAFFDSLSRPKLRRILQKRVVDGSLLRLIAKCLHVGILDGEEYSKPDEGTVQGSSLSPLLGNVYMHHVLDQWFEYEVKPQLAGHARLIRYCDDFVIGFVHRKDAERVLRMLHDRMSAYGLTLHPGKTRLIPFHRPKWDRNQRKGPGTFDFLGFTVFWQRARRGGWKLGMKTRKARLRRALKALNVWCRRQMHQPLKEQHASLSRRIIGHYNYFGVNGNIRALRYLLHRAERIWLRHLRRRSQRARCLTWEKYKRYLKRFPLPRPRIRVQIWSWVP
ncbi:group II intron reverse transcriptase/maturase [Myxococcota bacterium]